MHIIMIYWKYIIASFVIIIHRLEFNQEVIVSYFALIVYILIHFVFRFVIPIEVKLF